MLSRSNLQGSTFEAQHGFIMEYYLIVISIACVKRKIIKLKYPVACSRSVGAAGERDLLRSMIWGRAIQAFRVLGPSSLQGGFSKMLCWRLPIIAAKYT